MIDTADFHNGMKLELDGVLYEIVYFQHARTAQRRAFVRTKLKNIATGAVVEKTFAAGEKFPDTDFIERNMQFLYQGGDDYTFMDTKNYEQLTLKKNQLGDAWKFIQENIELAVQFHKGRTIGVRLPITVVFKVIETEPSFRGDTVSGGGKPAKIETGVTISVPVFVNVGDLIKIDTRTGEYIERVKG